MYKEVRCSSRIVNILFFHISHISKSSTCQSRKAIIFGNAFLDKTFEYNYPTQSTNQNTGFSQALKIFIKNTFSYIEGEEYCLRLILWSVIIYQYFMKCFSYLLPLFIYSNQDPLKRIQAVKVMKPPILYIYWSCWLIVGVLTPPLSTTFVLFCCGRFLWVEEVGVPWENHGPLIEELTILVN